MSYLVILKFNNVHNADNFIARYGMPLSADWAQVPEGYTPPSTSGIGAPNPGANPSTSTFVKIQPDTLSQIPQGYQPWLTYDLSPSTGPVLVGPVPPGVDITNLKVTVGPTGDTTLINKGIIPRNFVDQLTPPPGPIDFQPIYYDPVLFTPDRLSQVPLIEALPPGERPELNYNPYLLTPQQLQDIPPPTPDYLVPPETPLPRDPRIIPTTTLSDPEQLWERKQFDALPDPNPPGIDPNVYDPMEIDPRAYETQQQFLPFEMWPLNRPPPEPKIKPPQATPLPSQISDTEGGGSAPAFGPAGWGCIGGGQPQILAFDDSCTVYNSSDLGSNICQNTTPTPTLGDGWTDMAVPVNDAASPVPNVVALFDNAVNSVDSSRSAFIVISSKTTRVSGATSMSSLIYPSPGVIGDGNGTVAISAAISANGTILVPPNILASAPTLPQYPRISTNFGSTWSDVTGLPTAVRWTRACFSKNATTMYIHKRLDFIYKSTNSGSTWTALTSGPQFIATNSVQPPGDSENSLRLRCSSDGTVIAGYDWGGQFWISRNGGIAWNNTNFQSFFGFPPNDGGVGQADFGMNLTGTSFIATGVDPTGPHTRVALSSDGINWTDISGRCPSASTIRNNNCNMSPDGQSMIIGYQKATVFNADVSTDGGNTWKTVALGANAAAPSNSLVSVYMLPAGTLY